MQQNQQRNILLFNQNSAVPDIALEGQFEFDYNY